MLRVETVDRIRRLRGGRYPVLSVYLNVAAEIRETRSIRARLVDMLKPIEASARTMGHAGSTSLRADIEAVLESTERIGTDRGNGVAIFACHGMGLFEYFSFPCKVWDKAVADARPYIRPLMAILDEHHRSLAVIVDRRRSELFEFYMGELEAQAETVERGVRQANFGGWYGLAEYGVHHRAEEIAHRHYRETVRLVGDLFAERGAELLFVGGHRDTMDEFLAFLPRDLVMRLAGTFVIDPHTMTPAIVRDHCTGLEEAYERTQEGHAVDELMATVARKGRAVVGLENVVGAANRGAIDLLLVEGGVTAPGVVCARCGYLGLEGAACPICGSPLHMTSDVIDEVVELTIDEGGTIEHVFAPTALHEHAVGATLRFPI